MKRLFFVILIFVCSLAGMAQEKETMKFNTTNNTNEEFTNSVTKYPQFEKGRAVMKNGSSIPALLNYNYGTEEVLFLSPKNDTLALDDPGLYSQIVIGTDTFFFSKQGYVQLVSNGPYCKLVLKRRLDRIGSENKAAYGGYSSTSASTPLKSISDGAVVLNITTDQNILYKFRDTYFFVDRFNKLYPATKKGISEFAWKKPAVVKDFVEQNKIDFGRKEDLQKLLEFVRSVGLN